MLKKSAEGWIVTKSNMNRHTAHQGSRLVKSGGGDTKTRGKASRNINGYRTATSGRLTAFTRFTTNR